MKIKPRKKNDRIAFFRMSPAEYAKRKAALKLAKQSK